MPVNIPSLPAPSSQLVDASGRITTEWYVLFKTLYPVLRAAQSAVQEIPAVDPDTLYADVTDDLTVGFKSTLTANGTHTFSSGTFTVDAADGGLQKLTNTGAHTWAQPADGTSVMVRVINDAGAGAINIAAFEAHAGDDFDTVVGNKFWASITAIDGAAIISIVADEANT